MEIIFWIQKGFFYIFVLLIFWYGCIFLGNYCYKEGLPFYKTLYIIYRFLFILFQSTWCCLTNHKLRQFPQVIGKEIEQIYMNSEYWLYRRATLKSLGRASFLYFLIVCLFILWPYIHSSSPEVNIDDLIKSFQLFMVITIPFFTYWILSNNSPIDPPDEEINDFLRIFCRSSLLLKQGKIILQDESATGSQAHLGNAQFIYIKNEFGNILKYIEKNKYHQAKELSFIADMLQSTLQQFLECASPSSSLPLAQKHLGEFEKQYTRLQSIYTYFLNEEDSADYTKYFSSTYIDIKEIREIFFRITRDTEKEIEQILKFIE